MNTKTGVFLMVSERLNNHHDAGEKTLQKRVQGCTWRFCCLILLEYIIPKRSLGSVRTVVVLSLTVHCV